MNDGDIKDEIVKSLSKTIIKSLQTKAEEQHRRWYDAIKAVEDREDYVERVF